MNFVGALACLSVALNCAGKGAGYNEQVMFSQSMLWMWWPIAVVWFLYAIAFAFKMFRV
jgi:hypothetical protein